VLAAVHRLGVLEVATAEPSSPVEVASLRLAKPDLERIARVETTVRRLDALLSQIPEPPRHDEPLEREAAPSVVLDSVHPWLADVEPQIDALVSRMNALETEAANLRRYRDFMEQILPLAGDLVALEGFEAIALIIEPTYGYVLPGLRDEIASITPQSEIVAAESADGAIAALVVVDRRHAAEVHRLLESQRLSEVRLPAAYSGRPFKEIARELAGREQDIPRELDAVHRLIGGLLTPHMERMHVWRAVLLDEADELAAMGQCLESDHAFVLVGWVPTRNLPQLIAALAAVFGGRVAVEPMRIGQEDYGDVPVLLDNPTVIRPFEVLLRLLPPPRYGTIDPTVLVSFFFPIFFGFVLGDIGYGLLLLALASWVHWRWRRPPWLREASQVVRLSAAAAIAFGVAFGEFFGDLGHVVGLRPLVVERASAIEPLLVFSVGLGAVQVGLGLALGAVNAYLQRQKREVFAKAATLIGLAAIFTLVGTVGQLLPSSLLTPSLVLLAIVTALLVYSAGIGGPLELIGLVGNVLSYTRLVAVGLASVVLARVANEFAGLAGSALLGVVIGGLFHALNLALGLFSPSIQALRLQYVEFFGRFFEPGGRPYRPFRSRLATIAGVEGLV